VVRVISNYTDAFGIHTAISAETAFVNDGFYTSANGVTSIGASTGSAGNDFLIGRDSNLSQLTFFGYSGNDTIDGGARINNTYSNQNNNVDSVINLATGIASSAFSGIDTLISIENVIGSSANDLITGSSVANRLDGFNGNDTIDGGLGDDSIIGNGGVDLLTGGAGSDIFIFENLDTGVGVGLRDVITDFVTGVDKINLSNLDSNINSPVYVPFTFNTVAGAAFTAVGQLTYSYQGVGASEITILRGNVDATFTPDFEIQFTGHIVFNAATDFIL
jgi:Ca2+-binding RTX toxin-like protein